MKQHVSRNYVRKHLFASPLLITGIVALVAVLAFFASGCNLGVLVGTMSLAVAGGLVLPEAEFQAKILGGVDTLTQRQAAFDTKVADFEKRVAAFEAGTATSTKDIEALKKAANDLATEMQKMRALRSRSVTPAKPGHVSEECARHLGAIAIVGALKKGSVSGDRYEGIVKDILGIEVKTALSASDIPLPVDYDGNVVELVSQFGAARQYGTVFPLGTGVVKLPRLKTDTAFGLLAQSTAITEVSPQTEWVTFTAEKFGGLVRLPSEMDADSIVNIGQFVARYAARNIAKVEDTQFFISSGAGSGVNGSVAGLTYSTITNSKVTQMASTKTAYSDVTLTNLRNLRAVVDAAVIRTGAYYFHPSFEQKLAAFNSSGDKPYNPNAQLGNMNGQPFTAGATLDGYPIRWVDVMPAYSTGANASKVFGLFGDLSFQYLGVRGGVSFATSMEAGFTTDEILIRAMERMTIGLMATGAVAGIETAAS